MVGWCSDGAKAGKAVSADGGGEVGDCGAGDYDFPVEVFELVGGDYGLNHYFAFGDFRGGVLDEGESFEVFEVEEEVRDGGDVGDIQVDQGQVPQRERISGARVFREAPEGHAFEVLEAEGVEGWEVLEGEIVEVVHVEVGNAELF